MISHACTVVADARLHCSARADLTCTSIGIVKRLQYNVHYHDMHCHDNVH